VPLPLRKPFQVACDAQDGLERLRGQGLEGQTEDVDRFPATLTYLTTGAPSRPFVVGFLAFVGYLSSLEIRVVFASMLHTVTWHWPTRHANCLPHMFEEVSACAKAGSLGSSTHRRCCGYCAR